MGKYTISQGKNILNQKYVKITLNRSHHFMHDTHKTVGTLKYSTDQNINKRFYFYCPPQSFTFISFLTASLLNKTKNNTYHNKTNPLWWAYCNMNRRHSEYAQRGDPEYLHTADDSEYHLNQTETEKMNNKIYRNNK